MEFILEKYMEAYGMFVTPGGFVFLIGLIFYIYRYFKRIDDNLGSPDRTTIESQKEDLMEVRREVERSKYSGRKRELRLSSNMSGNARRIREYRDFRGYFIVLFIVMFIVTAIFNMIAK